jgi:hypothetical protein
MYYLAFPTDPKRNKFFVYSTFILEVMQTILVTRTAFQVFGEGYGNLANFDSIELAWFSMPIITGIGKYCIAKLPSNLYLRDSCSCLYYAKFLRLPNQRSFTIEMGRWCHYRGMHALGWSFHRIYLPVSSLFFNSGDRLHQLLFSTMLNYSVSFWGPTISLPLGYVLPAEPHTEKAQRWSGD